jgi:hypothetical protein
MATLFSGNLAVSAGEKTYTPIAVNGIQSAGKRLQVTIVMLGTAFPTGDTTLTIGLSTDGGSIYREASGMYTGPILPGIGGVIPDQDLGFLIGDTAMITHVRAKTIAPSAFTLPVTINAVEVAV